jgi:hypothetical protein
MPTTLCLSAVPRLKITTRAWARLIAAIPKAKVCPFPGSISQYEANAHPALSSYYDHNGAIRSNQAAFGQPHQNAHGSYYAHHQPQSYQPLYYHQPAPMNPRGYEMGHHAASFDARKRGYDELNDFFGSVKRRQVDPTSYQQVGRSLMPIHASLNGPLAAELIASHPPSLGVGAGMAQGPGPLTQHYYLPPMPNLRTKDDLHQIDHILEQMQSTIYENTAQQQQQHPQYAHAVDLRNSAHYAQRPSADPYGVAAAQQLPSPLAPSSSGTPAVTPPSATLSYTSGHSPSASSSGMSPASRHSSASVQYPSLPNSAYPGQQAPSTLGSSFDPVLRRHSGGYLQSANGARRSPDEPEGGATTPRAAQSPSASVSSPHESDGSDPEPYEDWIMNIRLIEKLRHYVHERLQTKAYEDANEEERIDPMIVDSERQRERAGRESSAGPTAKVEKPLYPSLPRIA